MSSSSISGFEDQVFVGLEKIPPPGEVAHAKDYVSTLGGGAVITAVAAARLGVHVSVASGLSRDGAHRLRQENIRVRNLRKHGEPSAVTAALSCGDERALVTFAGMNAQLEGRLARVLTRTRASHVHLAFSPHDCAAWAERLSVLKRRGIKLSGDFGWNERLFTDAGLPALFDTLDIVFVNEREANFYAKTKQLPAALPYWRKRKGVVVIKRGRQGALWLERDREHVARGRELQPVDTTGAGDSFNGGFLWAWLHKRPPAQCLAAGNFVGAQSTKKAGGLDALPRLAQLPRQLRRA
ncbi:MAG: carbohydrate kinase family protein [Acidobacteria bacterium]|nr:carbohydrate kinase family protein [Acidobacteriota bacterium]